jgi:putative transposase
MPRPQRIQFPNAHYHVMNRGIDGKEIFHNHKSYEIFLEILSESCSRFEVIIHSYCLMPNHYHLLLQTPKANLAKFMQYISATYTQRYNKFMKKDGPIFRGRFKSLLVEKDDYFLALSRYIHRNPIELALDLKDYKWSSYPAYLELISAPAWLCKVKILQILGFDKHDYQSFVMTKWASDKEKGSDPLRGQTP